jgi:hypothetical protein
MEERTKNGSSFIQELEERLNDIFQDEKPQQAEPPLAPEPANTAALDSINIVQGEESRGELLGELDESNSIMFSHIKDLKSIVLSLEWELNDETLARFDEEILKLEDIYSEDVFTLAFARILRFLGRYIRVKGTESEPRSINLLLSTYDNLETVLLSRNLPETEKYSLIVENISNYRQWVETQDLTTEKIEEIDGPGQAPTNAMPVLQVFAGKQEEEEARTESPAPEMESSSAETSQAESPSVEVSPEDSPSLEISQPEVEISSTAERSSALDEIELEGEAAQWKRAVEEDSIAASRPLEEEPVAPAGPGPFDEIRADVRKKDVLADDKLQAEDVRTEEILAAEVRESSIGPVEMKAKESFDRDDELAPALERIRQEIRNEIVQELRAEIDALREEIRSLTANRN